MKYYFASKFGINPNEFDGLKAEDVDALYLIGQEFDKKEVEDMEISASRQRARMM